MSAKKPNYFLIGIVVAVFLGLSSGYVGAVLTKPGVVQQTADSAKDANGKPTQETGIKVGQVFGSKDASAFKDSAEGVILAGGVAGEGSHHLVRPGGASQSVYLTSSVVDLKLFENAKVKVYGETFKAQKAGWLMDVGRVEVLAKNAPLPDWLRDAKPTPDETQGEDN